MQRLLFSTLAVLMSMGTLATTVSAEQVSLDSGMADMNGDGQTSLIELVNFNRDQRDKG